MELKTDIKVAIDNLLSRGEITQEEHEKVASLLDKKAGVEGVDAALDAGFLGNIGKKGGMFGKIMQGIALTSLAGIAGTQLYDLIKQKAHEATGFSAMMAKNPGLKEHPEEMVKDYYNVIQTFSPKSASNPLVSGALVNKMIEFGGVDHKLVQDISGIESTIAKSNKNILYEMAGAAGKGFAEPDDPFKKKSEKTDYRPSSKSY